MLHRAKVAAQAVAFRNCRPLGGVVYRELEDPAGFDRNCVGATSLLHHVFGVVPVPETKA